MKFLSNILDFLYPRQCEVCGRLLNDGEIMMCSWCMLGLPRTGFHLRADNPVAALFWGRVYIANAASWFHFNKGSSYQKLIHKLKYEGRKDIGLILGKFYAFELRETCFSGTDLIIPVPLHPRKERKRGYNQSELIASGISEVFNRPLLIGNLIRQAFTETQTKKSRFDRYLNMEGRFLVTDGTEVSGKHILLVDDVVTTGSTLETCAQVLLDAGCKSVSILTIAVA
jgi:ComF family protein